MAEKDKVFYWLKLKDSFMTSDTVDFLMSQKNGSEYVVLYQMLVLMTINTKGELGREIGEVIIPYDVAKIQRDSKWFSYDTVVVALQLYKKLGLVYEQDNGLLKISDFENLVGSETYWAKIKREERELLDNVQQQSNESPKSSISNISSLKSKSNKEIKHNYGKFKRIKLTESEYNKLIIDFNEEYINKVIAAIDEYVESNNNKNKYSNFNLVIRKAIRDNWTCLKGITAAKEIKMNANGGYDL